MHRSRGPLRALTPLIAATQAMAALTSCGEDDSRGRTTISETRWENVVLGQDLGCGYGFAATDRTEHFLLTVHVSADRGSTLPRTVELPDPAWDAELQTGEHLAANWCNDVLLDPQAEVARTWRLVAGTLTFEGELPVVRPANASSDVRDMLVGAVGEDEDGERVELGDVTLRNDRWGFFAG